jgi:hypothetical protein
MKLNGQNLTGAALACALMAALTSCNSTPPPEAQIQTRQVSTPTLTAADVPGPAPGNTITKEYVDMVGRMGPTSGDGLWLIRTTAARSSGKHQSSAGRWDRPRCSHWSSHDADQLHQPAETFVTCPNQDVVYGAGYFALDKEPVVF